MPGSDKTVYKICREQAGYTQERAAELLHCSVRTLCRYESGEIVPPNDIVTAMAGLYNNTYVVFAHVRDSSEIAAQFIPEIVPCGIQTAAMRCFNRIAQFMSRRPDLRLMEIAEDGLIDESEQQDLDQILADLSELIKVFTEVRLAARQGIGQAGQDV